MQVFDEIKIARKLSFAVENGDEIIDTFMNNYIEDIHSDIENDAINHLEDLRNCDLSFKEDEVSKIKFEIFLFAQYLRTNRMRSNLLAVFSNPVFKDRIGLLKESWPVYHLLAAIVWGTGYSLMAKNYQILKTSGNREFITGDQPVINTLATHGSIDNPVDGFELFYPISPKLALLLTKLDGEGIIEISDEKVDYYNMLVYKSSFDSIMGSSEDQLRRFCTE